MKRTSSFFAVLALMLPGIVFAQAAVTTVQNLFSFTLGLINGILVPIIFAVAFLFFIFGVYRYFISSGGNEEKVKEGQKFVMWSVVGFVLMFSIWGIINIFINTLGFGGASMPGIPTFGGTTGTTGTSLFGGTSTGSGLFGGTGATAGDVFTSGGVDYPITGTNTVSQVNGTCPTNFTETSNGQCQDITSASGSGTVATGGKCTSDGQCQGELACSANGTCQTDSTLENTGYGQGNGTVQQGGTCKSLDDCSGNLTCSANDVCVVDNNLDGAGFGKGAGNVMAGGACETNNDCSGNLSCTNGSCATDSNLDVGNGSLGSACQNSDQCSSNYECLNSVCSQPSNLGQQGDQCSSDDDCYGNLSCISGSCQTDNSLDSGDTFTDPDQ